MVCLSVCLCVLRLCCSIGWAVVWMMPPVVHASPSHICSWWQLLLLCTLYLHSCRQSLLRCALEVYTHVMQCIVLPAPCSTALLLLLVLHAAVNGCFVPVRCMRQRMLGAYQCHAFYNECHWLVVKCVSAPGAAVAASRPDLEFVGCCYPVVLLCSI